MSKKIISACLLAILLTSTTLPMQQQVTPESWSAWTGRMVKGSTLSVVTACSTVAGIALPSLGTWIFTGGAKNLIQRNMNADMRITEFVNPTNITTAIEALPLVGVGCILSGAVSLFIAYKAYLATEKCFNKEQQS